MWPWTRSRSRPASRGELDVAAQLVGGGLGEGHAGRAQVGALQEQPLAVDRAIQSSQRDLAQPGAAGARRSLDLVRRPSPRPSTSCSGWSPSAPRPPQAGSSTSNGPLDVVRARGQRLVQLARSTLADACVRTRTVRASSLSSVGAQPRATARSASASRHSTRRRSMRTGPVSSRRTGRQRPPGFQSGSMQSQCWNTPVMLRLARRSGWRRAGRPRRRARARRRAAAQVGDVERVGEEVALGVAEVGAVEPHVALVEDPVERQPAPARPPGPASSSKRRR